MPSPGNKPFPWDIVLWPFIWVFCAIADAWQQHRFQDPQTPAKPVVRLWDKDFNYLGTMPDLPWVVYTDDAPPVAVVVLDERDD